MARAVYLELMGGGGVEGAVQMDLSGIPVADLEHFAPDNLKLFARRGVSPHSSEIYVTPKAHFFMGGVPIDGTGATAVPGLYAGGEASAGAHGANRLSNNAFTEAHTLGWRAAKAAADSARGVNGAAINPALARSHADALTARAGRRNRAVELTREIKRVCWENAGIVREGGLLEEARAELAGVERGLNSCGGSEPARLVEAVEAENMCLSAQAVVESALTRAESRGAHFRTDYPDADEANWRVNVFVKKNENGFSAHLLPVGSISP